MVLLPYVHLTDNRPGQRNLFHRCVRVCSVEAQQRVGRTRARHIRNVGMVAPNRVKYGPWKGSFKDWTSSLALERESALSIINFHRRGDRKPLDLTFELRLWTDAVLMFPGVWSGDIARCPRRKSRVLEDGLGLPAELRQSGTGRPSKAQHASSELTIFIHLQNLGDEFQLCASTSGTRRFPKADLQLRVRWVEQQTSSNLENCYLQSFALIQLHFICFYAPVYGRTYNCENIPCLKRFISFFLLCITCIPQCKQTQ